MLEKIIDFECGGKPIAIVSYEGRVWFVGAQITGVLGYSQIATTVRSHCPDRTQVSSAVLRKAGVPVQSSSKTYIISPMSALRLVMKSPVSKDDSVRNLFLFVILPYLFANHALELGADKVDDTSLRMIYSQMSSALDKKGGGDTRIVAVHEPARK